VCQIQEDNVEGGHVCEGQNMFHHMTINNRLVSGGMPPSAKNCNHRNMCKKGRDVEESFE
jgi:hypothetical protein